MDPRIGIDAAVSADELAEVARLFAAYAASLDVDLAYQHFAAELAGLPGRYAPPEGALLLARTGLDEAVGCVGLRPLGPDICEMKRLYVAPQGRGLGLGRKLALAVIEAARRIGYRETRLDTLATMAAAQGRYRGLGFRPMKAYYASPVEGTTFMRLELRAGRHRLAFPRPYSSR